ncbi:MAG: ribonuclease D [Gammaproteobacteria bacterium]|nr:ribonuclease D [Gammaproteobacteria bacterium]
MLSDNGQQIEYIETQVALEESCRCWVASPVIAVDTEFVRTNTFYPKLGLLQIADESQCYLIDPLRIKDWSCFVGVLADSEREIVLHSGGEDLITLLVAIGKLPDTFFDTQIACAYAGLGFSKSYQSLVLEIIGRNLPKDQTRSDWLKRPLSASQLEYAANDVCYLLPIFRELKARLEERDYLGFLKEDAKVQVDYTKLCEQPEYWELAYTSISNSWRLNNSALACLQRLCAWRERHARKKNLPRSWIAKDADLLVIAQLMQEQRKLTIRDLNACAALESALVRRNGEAIIKLANSPPDVSLIDRSLLNPPLSASLRAVIKGFREKVQDHAKQMDISPELLARKKQLVTVALGIQRGNDPIWPQELRGWRGKRLATDFLEVASNLDSKGMSGND